VDEDKLVSVRNKHSQGLVRAVSGCIADVVVSRQPVRISSKKVSVSSCHTFPRADQYLGRSFNFFG
jgi:hypothetical protein